MIDSLDQLRDLHGKLEAKAARLQTQLAAAQKEQEEISTAIRVIERVTGQGAAAATANTPSENGATILKFVGHGADEALAPKEIQERLLEAGHDLNPDLVRTQLWRMAKRGMLESDAGRYWQPSSDNPFGAYADEIERRSEAMVDADLQRGSQGLYGSEQEDDVPF